MALLGVGAAAASALIAACGENKQKTVSDGAGHLDRTRHRRRSPTGIGEGAAHRAHHVAWAAG